MAWKSIWGKKGRSALTMLGIIIGIAAVMTIVSAINGYTEKTMEQYEAMGSNKLTVNIWNYLYDEDGNSLGQDYFPALYDYCNSIKEYVLGVTPQAYCNATVVYGTKSTANMSYNYDENGNLTGDVPPSIYYGSDQYSICNNLTLASGRDLSVLDIRGYKQVCVLGDRAAKIFFDAADPVGKVLQLNGQSFEVVGVYAPRLTGESASASQIDNVIILPYTARRVLGGDAPEQFIVKTRSSEDMSMMGNIQGTVMTVLVAIAAISLLVGGIGIMNIMLVTVTERTREIGIRRAIGAERSSIVIQFLIEAAMLCGIGGIIGILIGTGGSLLVGRLMFQMTIYPAAWITLCAFTLSVALGILFGIYPAAKAARLQPVEALRAE